MTYWAIATGGSGGNDHATVYGSYPSIGALEQANSNLVIGQFQIVGNQSGYPNQLEAQNAANQWNGQSSHPPVPGSSASNNPATFIPGASAVETVGQFLGKLGEPSLWLRVGEFVLGLALIAVGLAKLTGVENVISNTARKIPIGI